MTEQVLDTFGVPEYYADRLADIEDCGNGLIRCVRCVQKHGVLVPVYSVIVPACTLIQESAAIREIANKAFCISVRTGCH
jgi:hypothetical protein